MLRLTIQVQQKKYSDAENELTEIGKLVAEVCLPTEKPHYAEWISQQKTQIETLKKQGASSVGAKETPLQRRINERKGLSQKKSLVESLKPDTLGKKVAYGAVILGLVGLLVYKLN